MKSFSLVCIFVTSITVGFSQGQTLSAASSGTTTRLNAIDFSDSLTGCASGDGGTLVKTVNGGSTWTSQVSGTAQTLTAVRFTGPTTGYATGQGGVLLKTVNAGTTWTSLSSGSVQNLNGLWFTDSSTGYVVGSGGEILKTSNGGSTWIALSSGVTSALNAVVFTSSAVGYAGGNNGVLLKTVNSGSSWQVMNAPGSQNVRTFVATDSVTLYAGTSTNLWKTTNAGMNWTALSWSPTNITSLAWSGQTQTLYLGNDGFFKSTDAGQTWVQVSGGQSFVKAVWAQNARVFTVGELGGIMGTIPPFGLTYSKDTLIYQVGVAAPTSGRSLQSGAASLWTISPALPAGLNLDNGDITGTPQSVSPLTTYTVTVSNEYGSAQKTIVRGVALPPPPSNLVYASDTVTYIAGLSASNTPTFTGVAVRLSVSPPLPAGLSLDSVTGVISGVPTAPASAKNYTVTAANAGGATTRILRIAVSNPAPWRVVLDGKIQAMNFPDANSGYTIGGGSIKCTEGAGHPCVIPDYSFSFVTTDAGANWIPGGPDVYNSQTSTRVISATFFAAGQAFVYGAPGNSGAPAYFRKVTWSPGAQNWSVASVNYPSNQYPALDGMRFFNANLGYVSWSGSLHRTTDGGSTWTTVLDGNVGAMPVFRDANNGFIASPNSGKVFTSGDGGITWAETATGVSGTLREFAFANSLSGFALGTPGVIYKTTNGGATWASVGAGTTQELRGIFALDPNNAYAVGAGGAAVRSTNGGVSWTSIQTPVSDTLKEVVFLDQNLGYARSDKQVLKFDPLYVSVAPAVKRSPSFGTIRNGVFTYTLPTASSLQARLVDVRGREAWRFEADQGAGAHSLKLPLEALGNALYLLEVRAGSQRQIVRVPPR